MRARSSLSALALLVGCGMSPADPPLLDPNVAEFPDSSLVDFGARVEPRPEGFLAVDAEGRFVWPDGRRARFWGINVAAESVFQPFARIDTCVARIKRAGFDLVRIHHVDGTARGILVGGQDSSTFDPEKLKQLDYWIWSCGQAGLAVYLDLLDYREFVAGDGVPAADQLGRAAKPYALFDRQLIDLQKRYAKALLRDHVNPFNGLAYADDPTITMVELFDENGLFIRRADWPKLVEPYRSRLTRLWNQFLTERYGSTATLVAAWRESGVSQPIAAGERIENGSLPLPTLALEPDRPAETAREKLARAKAADAARFADWVHRAYYRELRAYLRERLGVRVPLSAVGDGNIVPDLAGVADELDFTGTNWYWDHPLFRAGRAWHLPFLFHYRNPLAAVDAEAFGPKASLAKMHGAPVVIREWNVCFPNPHRAAGMIEAAAYAALQDIDAMILFTYGAIPTHRKLGYFDVHQDPTRWGLAAVCGEIFRGRAVAPARRRIDLAHSETDTFAFREYRNDVRDLGYVSRLANRVFRDRLAADADLTLTSGRSSTGTYSGGPRLLYRNDPILRTSGAVTIDTADWFGYPLGLRQGSTALLSWDGSVLMPPGLHSRLPGGRFAVRAVEAAGARPLGIGGDVAAGFVDLDERVIGFGRLEQGEAIRAALDALRLFHGDSVGGDDWLSDRLVSDTGELIRDSRAGRMTIIAPRVIAVAGEFGPLPLDLGDLRLVTGTPRGAFVILSLDQRPLSESRVWVAKLVGDAQNRSMDVRPPGPRSNPRDRWELLDDGTGPVTTGGRAAAGGLKVYRDGKLLFAADQIGGVFELARDAGGWRWFGDTPGVTVDLPEASRAWNITAGGTEQRLPGSGRWIVESGVALQRAE